MLIIRRDTFLLKVTAPSTYEEVNNKEHQILMKTFLGGELLEAEKKKWLVSSTKYGYDRFLNRANDVS